jgi:hypothetical protein
VIACEEARGAAMLAGDADALASLFSDELQYVHSTGAGATKGRPAGKGRSEQFHRSCRETLNPAKARRGRLLSDCMAVSGLSLLTL